METLTIKPLVLVRAPVATRSGYGELSRQIVRNLIALDKYEVVIMSVNWGSTPMNALNPTDPRDTVIIQRLMQQPVLPRKPDIHISITIPPEFQPMGNYNIGITAGIETSICAPDWLEGCNRMNLVLATSKFAKDVLANTSYTKKDQSGAVLGELKLTTPIDVLPYGVDTNIFKAIPSKDVSQEIKDLLFDIKESFCFLFVGHWLGGDIGQDRKDVGMLTKVFLETFKDVPSMTRPALILKTSGGNFSIMDREEILRKLNAIKEMVPGVNLPNVYLVHGDLTEAEMNSLYNHPKIKVHATFTKGEGFGVPLLEATMSEKPVVASGWSGHLDFLDPENSILLNGKITPAAANAQWNGKAVDNAGWFTVDYGLASNVLKFIWKNYDKFVPKAEKRAKLNRQNFSNEATRNTLSALLEKYLPTFAVQAPLKLDLPPLRRLEDIKP